MNDLIQIPNDQLPAADPNKEAVIKQIGEIGVALSEEIKKRLETPKYIRKLDTGSIMDYLLRIASILNKQPSVVIPTINYNLSAASKRVIELDTHPARRKQYREQIRKLNGISR